MFQIILKSAWRRLWKHQGYSAINILGLTVGLAVAILSGLWVQYQSAFDKFHTNGDHIYQAVQNFTPTGEEMSTHPAMPLPFVKIFREETPGIKHVAVTGWGYPGVLGVGEMKLRRRGIYTEPSFLQMFTFPLLQGDLKEALNAPNQIVLSESLAKELFGEADPMGQTINVDNEVDLQVSGVLADVPDQSTIDFEFLLPWSLKLQREDWVKDAQTNWGNSSFQIYFETEIGADVEAIKALHTGLFAEHEPNSTSELNAHSLSQWHLYNDFEHGVPVTGRIRYVKLFGIIGIMVLLIACINFVNITTARAEKRSKEVGVRKAIGAQRASLMIQFLGESALTLVVSMGGALLLVQLLLPSFNGLVEAALAIPWTMPEFWLSLLGVLILCTLLAGSYPAFFLTRFEARAALQRSFQIGRGRHMWSRRALVATQFAVSIALIAGSLVVHQQVRFAQERDRGYNQERLFSVPNTLTLDPKYETVRTELLATGLLERASATGSPVTEVWSNMGGIQWPGRMEDEQLAFAFIAVSDNYFETLEIPMTEGRPFDQQRHGLDTAAMIVNEAAVRRMNLEDPLATQLEWNDADFQIIGVAKDMIMETPFEPVRPTVFILNPNWRSFYLLRLREGTDTEQALTRIGAIFEEHDPNTPFSYEFVEDAYRDKLSNTNFVGTVALLFAGLAIFLSALGLLGLAVYLAERRAKEISVRKILGASIAQLWLLLSQEFIWLIVLGGLIAIPLGAYFLQGWLDNFTYRIDLPWWMFGVAAGIALTVALATISVQSIKAALVNPATRLRDE